MVRAGIRVSAEGEGRIKGRGGGWVNVGGWVRAFCWRGGYGKGEGPGGGEGRGTRGEGKGLGVKE